MDGLAGLHNGFRSAKGSLNLALEKNEGLFKIMAVPSRAAARWNMHVDEAEASICVLPRQEGGVCVSYQPDMRQVGVIRSSVDEEDGWDHPREWMNPIEL